MKKFLKWLFIIALIIISIIIYARYIGTLGLITKEYTIKDTNLPSDFDGLKIVHFSDLHYNRALNITKLNKVVKEINNINPDIVVFTGDLIDKDSNLTDNDYIELSNILNNINAKYGKYAILGNHDIGEYKDSVIKTYINSNFTFLDNNHDIIYSKNNERIFIGGISPITNNTLDINKTLNVENIDSDYKIILIHEPDITDDIVKNYQVNLILAGHSHNGQIRLPIIGAIYTPPYAKKYYDEYYKIDNTNLYISSGIGVSTINYRLFNHPSINFYRLNKN